MTTANRTFTVPVTVPDNDEGNEFLRDIFITALEGGIGYWSVCETYQPGDGDAYTDFFAEIIDNDDQEHHISIDTVLTGLERICAARAPYYAPNAPAAEFRTQCADVKYLTQYVHDTVLTAVNTLDAGDIDAILADNIIQAGLFGEIVYG